MSYFPQLKRSGVATSEELTRPGKKAMVPLNSRPSLSQRGNTVTPQTSVRWADAAGLTAHIAVSLGSHVKATPSYFFGSGINYRASHHRNPTVEPYMH